MDRNFPGKEIGSSWATDQILKESPKARMSRPCFLLLFIPLSPGTAQLFLPGISNAFSFRACLQHNRDILFHQFDAAHFLWPYFFPKDMLPRAICCLSHSWCETGQGPPVPSPDCLSLDWFSHSVSLTAS